MRRPCAAADSLTRLGGRTAIDRRRDLVNNQPAIRRRR